MRSEKFERLGLGIGVCGSAFSGQTRKIAMINTTE